MDALLVGELVILALVLVLVFGLLRSHAAILRRLHELEGTDRDAGPAPVRIADPAAAAPAVRGETLSGEQVVVPVAGVGHQTILAFLSSGCLTCKTFWKEFAGDGFTLPANTRLVIVAKDLDEESPSELAALAPRNVDLVCSSNTWTDYQVPGSPYVVAVEGASGRIMGEGTGMSWEQVAGLLAQATGDRAYVTAPGGKPVPKPESDVEREQRADGELLAAGILPGDPSLYPMGRDDDAGRR